MVAQVLALYVCRAGAAMNFRSAAARAISGYGFEGDTRCQEDGSLLFVSQEAIDEFNRTFRQDIRFEEMGCHVLLEGIDFSRLIGRMFVIGEVTLKGTGMSRPSVKGSFHVSSVLKANILSSGVIRAGDPVIELEF